MFFAATEGRGIVFRIIDLIFYAVEGKRVKKLVVEMRDWFAGKMRKKDKRKGKCARQKKKMMDLG